MNLKVKKKDDDAVEDDGEIPFEQWAISKYREVVRSINPCDKNGEIDPVQLNTVLSQFSQHFAWAITTLEVETNKLNILSHEFDNWSKARYNDAYRLIRDETGGGRAPGQTTIESRIVDLFGDELQAKQIDITKQKSRVDLLKGMVRVLEKQASMIQTLSSNMRSEMFFAGGVSLGDGRMSDQQRNNVTKAMLRSAIKGQQTEDSVESES